MFGRRLRAEHALMRQALKYYAQRGIWRRASTHTKGTPVRYQPAPVIHDKGATARNALHQLQRKQPPMSLFALIRRTFSRR